ncbi:MAG: gamma-glutamyltransferase [bacterium]
MALLRASLSFAGVFFFTIRIAIAAPPLPAQAKNGMVVSAHPLASAAGLKMLQGGGNAVDAAVATAFALSVVEPYHSGLGGGGFMLIRRARTGRIVTIDYRETAPQKAHRNMYVKNGKVIWERSTIGAQAAAVPGMVAGLTLALKEYGTKSLKEVLGPAIHYAEKGSKVGKVYSRYAEEVLPQLLRFPQSAEVFLKDGKTPPEPEDVLIQKDLAHTLRLIATGGTEPFYRGEIAERIAEWMTENGGLITKSDLENYRPILREPLRGTYRGYEIISMPPPTSGGVHLIQMLNILEGFDLKAIGHNSAEIIHLMAETMKLAFADRAHYLGDPDFVDVPVEGLISKQYAEALRAKIDHSLVQKVMGHGTPRDYIPSGGTTHLSVIDGEGNVVSLTQTINLAFGSKAVVPGTGILLNNEMDDFSGQPGAPNAFGLVGGEANAIAPGKRPLSSMTPTMVLKDGRPFIVIGSPGGPKIITTVLQVIINIIDHGLDIQEAIDAPRVHHQWLPDVLRIEQGVPDEVVDRLKEKGHTIEVGGQWGGAQGILIDTETGIYYGGTDLRLEGAATGY